MPRSKILSGMIQQRDRAQQRGRLDRRRAGGSDEAGPQAELEAWLRENVAVDEVEVIESLDLRGYLRATAGIVLPAEERLRRLAIALEAKISRRKEQPRAWLALDRIYVAALRHNPSDPWIHHSRALSAQECAESLERGLRAGDRQAWQASEVRKRMMRTAYAAAHEAIRLAPEDASVFEVMGMLCYNDPDTSASEALAWYERALAVDPKEGWSRLYRAHCLHDLSRWAEAAEAYDAVDPAFFTQPNKVWRYEHLLEQRAYCWMRAGEASRARDEFIALLERWEKNLDLASMGWGNELAEAAAGPLREALFERARALYERVEEAQARHPSGFGCFGLMGLSALLTP